MEINQLSKRWLSTGFMAGGVQSVDAGAHTLKSAVIVRPGEALGHGVWIDKAFCQTITEMAAQGKLAVAGVKARFGHPNMCSDALGTFLGRWKGLTIDEAGFVRGDLHLSSTASESPKGDLRKYVEEMAAKEPDHFGASIVFSIDGEAMKNECIKNGATESDMGLDLSGFKSPDPANVKNLPHARCAELHAADLVDDPAATDGIFSGAAGMSLAGQMTEFLDTHPEVFKAMNDEPELLNIVTRYADQLKPFLGRYTESLEKKPLAEPPIDAPKGDPCTECGGTGKCAECDGTGSMKPAAEPAGDSPAESGEKPADVPMSQAADQEKILGLTGQLSGVSIERDGLKAELEARSTELTATASALKAAEERIKAIELERDEANAKLAAIEAGQPPLSSTAIIDKPSAMEVARKTARI